MNRNLRLRPLAYSAERPEPGSVSAVAIEFAGSWGCRRATAVVEGARGQRCVRSCSCCSEHFSFDFIVFILGFRAYSIKASKRSPSCPLVRPWG